MSKMKNRISGIVFAIPFLLVGCGAGSANIPESVPPPKKMGALPGQSLADVAKSKGATMPADTGAAPNQPPVSRRGFNPTNPQ